MLSEAETALIREILLRELSPWLILLFGSHAENRARPDSDVDLAYASDTPVDHVRRFEIAQKLAEAIDRDVDLVDLDAASTVLQTQILQGVVLHCSDETRRLLLEAKIFKMYAKLNEERKIILDGILERGTVYEDGCRSQ